MGSVGVKMSPEKQKVEPILNASEEKTVIKNLKSEIGSSVGIELRPSNGSGLWLAYLLPIAYAVNWWQHQRSVSYEYVFSTIISIGLALQTQAIYLDERAIQYLLFFTPPIATSTLIFYFFQYHIVCSVLIGFLITSTYRALFLYVLRKMPKSFTYGEAAIVIQGFSIFLINLILKSITMLGKIKSCKAYVNSMSCASPHGTKTNLWTLSDNSEMEQLSTILQIGLLGVTFIVSCTHFIKFFRGLAFYVLLAVTGAIVVLFPIGNRWAVFVLIDFITKDLQKLCMISLYMGLIGVTVATVIWQMKRSEQSNTRTRKIFHVLIVLVFMPGLIYQCSFLFIASGVALALLVILETMRIIQLPPIHSALENSVKSFIDEKDAGLVALTPIYLLVGCSIPLWIHPCPCDLTDSAGFELIPLMSGVISVGVGDTAASIVGSKFGRFKFPGSNKTIEGTIAGILAQAAILPLMIYFGLVQPSTFLIIKFSTAITVGSLIETFTDQVDNLVLPLVMYILLSWEN